jgi:hypothetical protein
MIQFCNFSDLWDVCELKQALNFFNVRTSISWHQSCNPQCIGSGWHRKWNWILCSEGWVGPYNGVERCRLWAEVCWESIVYHRDLRPCLWLSTCESSLFRMSCRVSNRWTCEKGTIYLYRWFFYLVFSSILGSSTE